MRTPPPPPPPQSCPLAAATATRSRSRAKPAITRLVTSATRAATLATTATDNNDNSNDDDDDNSDNDDNSCGDDNDNDEAPLVPTGKSAKRVAASSAAAERVYKNSEEERLRMRTLKAQQRAAQRAGQPAKPKAKHARGPNSRTTNKAASSSATAATAATAAPTSKLPHTDILQMGNDLLQRTATSLLKEAQPLPGGKDGCLTLLNRATNRPNGDPTAGYFHIKVKPDNVATGTIKRVGGLAHAITYLALHPNTELRHDHDMSHRCHCNQCINPKHVIYETKAKNNQRKNCRGVTKSQINGMWYYIENCVHGDDDATRCLPRAPAGANVVMAQAQ